MSSRGVLGGINHGGTPARGYPSQGVSQPGEVPQPGNPQARSGQGDTPARYRPPRPGQDGGVPSQGVPQLGTPGRVPPSGVPSPQDKTAHGVLDTPWSVCILRSCRRTFLLTGYSPRIKVTNNLFRLEHLFPPAYEVRQEGTVFTGVCLSMGGGGSGYHSLWFLILSGEREQEGTPISGPWSFLGGGRGKGTPVSHPWSFFRRLSPLYPLPLARTWVPLPLFPPPIQDRDTLLPPSLARIGVPLPLPPAWAGVLFLPLPSSQPSPPSPPPQDSGPISSPSPSQDRDTLLPPSLARIGVPLPLPQPGQEYSCFPSPPLNPPLPLSRPKTVVQSAPLLPARTGIPLPPLPGHYTPVWCRRYAFCVHAGGLSC